MNQALSSLGVAVSASGLWLIDAAIKGAFLLVIAGFFTLLMRRDSAAARHWVWLVAIVAMLVVPLMSAVLPQWRVLPAWVVLPDISVSKIESAGNDSTIVRVVEGASLGESDVPLSPTYEYSPQMGPRFDSSTGNSSKVDAKQPELSTVLAQARGAKSATGLLRERWHSALPWCWGIGAVFLFVRLIAARVLLWRIESESRVIESQSHDELDAALFNPLSAACSEIRIAQRITLLVHPEKNIPIVWGIWKIRMLLPEEAFYWSEEQLRSVLLHELAHIKRRDFVSQLLAQTACALHWFNPLIWFAAWRMHVERERACDDLVLASGVRASAYAEHLLSVATRLTSSRWTQACGLAMARSSSTLHSRLAAVLNARQNRRSLTSFLLGLSVLVSTAIAVPVAMMSAAVKVSAMPMSSEIAEAPLAGQTVVANSIDPPSGIEQYLDWSEPVGGLRGAIMIRSVDSPGVIGKRRRIFFVIQNVSDQAVRFCDTDIHETDIPAADVEGQKLYLKQNGDIMFGLQNAKSTKTDRVLQPQEVLSLNIFEHEESKDQAQRTGDLIAEGIVKFPAQALFAKMNIVHAPDGAWTGKLVTPTTRGLFAAEGGMPKSKEGGLLFRYYIDHARLNGEIPGGLLSRLHDLVQEFIRNNTGDRSGDSYAKKMQPLLERFEHKGDWKQADVIALFDDIAVVTTIPLERTMEVIRETTLQRGIPLPTSLKDANWGEALPGGLRMAWILEPRQDKFHLGSSLKSRVVLHNSGSEPVMFVTRSFQQPQHTVVKADGAPIKLDATDWMTRARIEPYRLHPGESCEIIAPGIGIGAHNSKLEDWSNVRAGTWILAKEGDEVIFRPGAVFLSSDYNEKVDSDWWLKFITERIQRDTPLPTDAKEREVVLFRVVSDLFGTSPITDEATSFLADQSPDAVSNLAKLLQKRTWHKSASGTIKSGELRFHVLSEDLSVVTRPRVTMNPGHFNLGDQVRLIVNRRPEGERVVNEANIVWYPKGRDNVLTKVPLPVNYDTWSAGWAPGSTVLWVSQEGILDSYDFTDNASVKVAHYEGEQLLAAPIPNVVREALRVAMERAVPQDKPKPRPPAATQK